jgi:hypothetical protein
MGTVVAVGLAVIGTILFVAAKKRWIRSDTIQLGANVAAIVALLAAIVVFIVPATPPPQQTNTPSPLTGTSQEPRITYTPVRSTVTTVPSIVENTKSKSPGDANPETEFEQDHIAVTAIKTVAVLYLLILAATLTFFTGLIDLVLVLLGLNFPLTTGLWTFVWQTVTINWYWHHAGTMGVIIGGIIVLIFLAAYAADRMSD